MDHPSTSKRARTQAPMDESEDSDFDDIAYDSDIISESDRESDSDSENESIAPDWSYSQEPVTQIPFCGIPGIKVPLMGSNPIDYFHLIADDEFYNLIIIRSNEYAVEVLSRSLGDRSRITQWKDITVEEFKIWLGLVFHMGTIRLNRISDYWKKDYLFKMNAFSQFMSRDRFFLILRALHFNTNNENSSSLDKIKPLINFFNDRMNIIYVPKQNLSIDESLVLWRGRLIFRQYMKGKKSRYGVKLYILAESCGLAIKLIMYGGSADDELGGKNHTQKVVMKLIEGRTGIGHSLFVDNYYTSVQLVENLLKEKIFVTGTLRINRKGNPEEVVRKKLKSGERVSQYKKTGICVTKWKDRREILTISSEFDGEIINTTNRLGKQCQMPTMVAEYNKFMSGVDFHDQMLAYYPCQRKTLRWYKKLSIHIFQSILLNAYYLYISEMPKISFYDFRISVIRSLLGPPPPTLPQQPRTKIHLPRFCEKDDKGNTKRRRCKYCWQTTKTRKASLFCCYDCPETPGLCLEPCFKLYHNY